MAERADVVTITVPTELGRQDMFWDMSALAIAAWVVWTGSQHGVPWPVLVLPAVLVALITLTGEPAADVPFLGAVAAGLRSKLGLRRAHEWALAWCHYFRVRIWPDWRAGYARQSARSLRATRSMGRRLLEAAGGARTRVVHLYFANVAHRRDVDVLERPAP